MPARRIAQLVSATACLCAATAGPALAVPPTNDSASGALTIPDGPFPSGSPLVPDITDATSAGDPAPSCGQPVSRGVWFTFTPSQAGSYVLSTAVDRGTGSTVDDTVLAIFTSTGGNAGPFTEVPLTGVTQGCDNDGADDEPNQSTLISRLAAGKQYYVVVWKRNTLAPTPGNTAVQVAANRITVPTPAGDTAADAIPLALDRPVDLNAFGADDHYRLASGSPCLAAGSSGTTASGTDIVLRFRAPTDGAYAFRAQAIDDQTLPNTVLYLADSPPSGPAPANVACSTAANRASGNSGFSTEVINSVPLAAGQVVYVFADRHSPGPGGPLRVEATRSSSETEPNDSPATANAPVCGLHGRLVNTDTDFYSLGAPAAGSRVFAMAPAIGAAITDTDIRLTSATDTLEYDDFNLDTPFGTLGGVIAGAPATGVPLFLEVDIFGTGSLTIDPYQLHWTVQPPIGGATGESEPNNSIQTAAAGAANYFQGVLSSPGPSTDVDVYRFEADAGTPVFVGLDGDPARNNTALNARVDLLDAAGQRIISVNDSGSSSTTVASPGTLQGTTPSSPAEGLVWRVPTTGTYYVRVTAGTAAAATGAGDYLLSISLGCSTGAAPKILDSTLPDATQGTPYSKTLSAANVSGAAQFSIADGTLPPGLSLSAAGVVSGTPTAPGEHPVQIRVADDRGLTWTQAFTLKVAPALPAGGSTAGGELAGGGAPPADTSLPVVADFRVSNPVFAPARVAAAAAKRGTKFLFRLSENANVVLTVARQIPGRRSGRRCVKPTKALRRKPACKRFVTRGTLTFAGQAGQNSRGFDGRLRGKPLRPGSYRATLVATDTARNRSRPVAVAFRVVKP